MVSFRRCILALTVLALFAGMASAQLLTCATNVSVTPTLRAEGYTEQTGDITLTCTGGTVPAVGTQVPQVNIQIFLNTAVTSRLLPVSGLNNNISEALLLIDEPGSGLAGTSNTQLVCGAANTFGASLINGTTISTNGTGATAGNATTGCIAYAGAGNTAVASCATAANGVCTVPSALPAANIYQGIVNGNSVTFFGIPVLPPGTAASRVFHQQHSCERDLAQWRFGRGCYPGHCFHLHQRRNLAPDHESDPHRWLRAERSYRFGRQRQQPEPVQQHESGSLGVDDLR
jgi:hypothetical protein